MPTSTFWRSGGTRTGIAKQAFRWEAAPEDRLVTVWSRVERVAPATVRMFLSDDAAWLGLFGWRLVVFDVVSGDAVLQFPLRGDKEAEFARLRDVLPADATVADVARQRTRTSPTACCCCAARCRSVALPGPAGRRKWWMCSA